MSDWYNPASWKFQLPGSNTSDTFGGTFFHGPDMGQAGERLRTAGSALGDFAQGQMPNPADYGGVGSPGYPDVTALGPSQGRIDAGLSRLQTQLMNAQQPFFRELDRQDALKRWAGALDTQGLSLQEQKLRGDIAAKQKENALDTRDVSAKRKRLGMEPGFIERAFGLDTREQANAEGKARDQYSTGLRNLYSDATARGALTTKGARDQRGDLASQLMRNLEDVGVARGRSQLGKERSLADTQQAQALLDTEAQKIGLSGQDLQRQLDQGLAQLGLQGQINGMDLAVALASTDVEKVKAASQVTQMLAALTPQQAASFAGSGTPAQTSFGGRGMPLR